MVKAKQLVSLSAITSDAQKLGQVTATDVDTDSWTVTHLHIDLTDEMIRSLAYKKPFMGGINVCLPVAYVSKVKDVVALNIPVAELKNVPECKPK